MNALLILTHPNRFSGFQDKQLHNLFAVTTVGYQESRLMLDEVRNLVNNYF